MTRVMRPERGMGLVIVLLTMGFFSIAGLGLALMIAGNLWAETNHAAAVAMLDAAEAGIELAARDLAVEADWNSVLMGGVQGSRTDGSPGGIKALPFAGVIDLTALTDMFNCGSRTACTPVQMDAVSSDRPWGKNNPRWQPFIYGPLSQLRILPRDPSFYLVVWVADDPIETDGDPLRDGADVLNPGRGRLQLRSEVFGPSGARSAVEALVSRVCRTEKMMDNCLPGLRVQSWREVRQLIP